MDKAPEKVVQEKNNLPISEYPKNTLISSTSKGKFIGLANLHTQLL